MDLTVAVEDSAFRTEVREWLAATKPGSMSALDSAEGFAAHREWERKLFDARLSAVPWPREYGGRGASPWQWLIFEEEYYRAEAPVRVSQNGLFQLAPTLFEYLTPEQRDRFLLRMARADDIWAQAWSSLGPGATWRRCAARLRASMADGARMARRYGAPAHRLPTGASASSGPIRTRRRAPAAVSAERTGIILAGR